MLKQLRNVVRAATSSNPLHKYKLDDTTTIKGGRHNLFTIYRAMEYSTKKEVSVFMVLLKEIHARCDTEAEATRVMSQVRAGVALLARLRHDSILQVVRPLTEDSKRMWFVTERVVDHVPQMRLSEMPTQAKLIELRRCAMAMRFVHETADMLLVNFGPHALYVTTAGQWKVGDFIHAVPRTQLNTPTLPYSFCALDAPLLDYMAYEYVDFAVAQADHSTSSSSAMPARKNRHNDLGSCHNNYPTSSNSYTSDDNNTTNYRHSNNTSGDMTTTTRNTTVTDARNSVLANSAHESVDAMKSLFDSPASSSPLVFPDTDSYALLLTTVEVVTGKKLFQCVGQLSQHHAQRRSNEAVVAQYFSATMLHLPRPPVSVIVTTGAYNTTDVQLLVALETYPDMQRAEQFHTLQGVYNGLSGGVFCELVVIRYIIPVIIQAGANGSANEAATDATRLRYTVPILLQCCAILTTQGFQAHLRDYMVSLITAMTKTTAFGTVEVLAQQMLEKISSLRRHLHTGADENNILLPFLVKCLSCSSHVVLLRLALEALQSLLQLRSAAGGLALPSHLAETLVQIAMKAPNLFARSIDCLELVLPSSSLAVRQSCEGQLLGVLDVLAATEASESTSMRVMQLLRQLEKELPLEHIANQSVPRRSALLLSTHLVVRRFAMSSILDCVRRFDDSTELTGKGAEAASALVDKQSPVPWWSPSAPVSQSHTGGGGGGPSASSTNISTTIASTTNIYNKKNNSNDDVHCNKTATTGSSSVSVAAYVGNSASSSASSLAATPSPTWHDGKKVDFTSAPAFSLAWGAAETCATASSPDVVRVVPTSQSMLDGSYQTIHVDCTSTTPMWTDRRTSAPPETNKYDDLVVAFDLA